MATLLAPRSLPAMLHSRPWGGQRLAELRGATSRCIGESWEFSTLAGRVSQTDRGPLDRVLGRPLPFIAKLIDTAAPLSVQVHPPDDPATQRGGKEEAWVVLDASVGAELRVGLRGGASPGALRQAVELTRQGHGQPLLDLLEPIEAAPGTIVVVPAGTVHAIGAGILLAEIQQPIDCTYRLFDYGRGRELHHDLAAAVIDASARAAVSRPSDAAAALRGTHLDLLRLDAGEHDCPHPGHDILLVAVGQPCTLSHVQGKTTVAPNDLRLWVNGRVRVRVEPGACLVLASLTR
ncbi:MAG: hypothetical protein B7733_12130 [Myxococcales bacterium FL481]|nr:MAG: hypothetical protein B7733_12130 [Myxococcales bacterium FL481]